MKIGIITILKVNNYGAELQAYATQAVLNRMGYDAEIIDYLFYKNPKHKTTRLSKPIFRHGIKKQLSEYLYPMIEKIKAGKYREDNLKRIARFEKFHRERTRMSQTYRTMDELYTNVPDYDIYMVGSDQVWNPGIYSSIEPYFLTFAPKGKKRIAYASSFGISTLTDSYIPFYRKALKEMDAIGVREEQAVDLVKEVSGKNATLVLDPTLLLTATEWKQVAHPAVTLNEKYLLIYELTPCPYIKTLATYFGKMLNYRIIRICKQAVVEDKETEILNVTDAGPAEFLHFFSEASLILTNSFHGTAFSINFGKDFYTITPARKTNNCRQQSLLRLMGLENRLLQENAPLPNLTKVAMDYTLVRSILEKERVKSTLFINKAIHGE